jgi:hypothetical protein
VYSTGKTMFFEMGKEGNEMAKKLYGKKTSKGLYNLKMIEFGTFFGEE